VRLIPVPRTTSRLALLVGSVSLTALVLGSAAWLWHPLSSDIGGLSGLAFWVLVVLLAAAAPVGVAGGAVADVTIAPILAAVALGGPQAAVIVAVFGTIERRELRGLIGRSDGIPWYGSLYNHASIVIQSVLAALFIELFLPSPFVPDARSLAVVVMAGVIYFAVNNILAAAPVSIRAQRSFRSVIEGNVRQYGVSLAGLAPLSWLMTAMYVVGGPVGVLPFAVPLYATRVGFKKVLEIRDMFTQTVRSLAGAIDAKDPFTAGHSERVQLIAKDLGQELRCSEGELEALEWGGLLHDVGKIGIPDAVLLKTGALDKEERMIMNAHPVKGEEILRPVQKLAPELPIIRHHHEWFNGSGYPDRLVGAEIPRLARIMHVADSYEAMTAARPYRLTPLSQAQALEELHKFSGIQFDPEVVAAFDRLVKQNPAWLKPNIPMHLVEKYIPKLGETEATPAPA
jgi:HD-GYP domain-containing protein (c-di-GMP phosphodiesterase class II)